MSEEKYENANTEEEAGSFLPVSSGKICSMTEGPGTESLFVACERLPIARTCETTMGHENRPHLLWSSKRSQSNNIQFLQNYSYLTKVSGQLLSQHNWSSCCGSYMRSFGVTRIISPVDPPEWHTIEVFDWKPNSNVVAVGDFAGDIFVLRLDQSAAHTGVQSDNYSLSSPIFRGTGALSQPVGLKWSNNRHQSFFAVKMNVVSEYHPDVGRESVLYGGIECPEQFTCLDQSVDGMVVVGKSKGSVEAFDDRQHSLLWKYQMHSHSVRRLAFNPVESWLLASADFQGVVRLWDIRMLSNEVTSMKKPMEELFKEAHRDILTFAVFNGKGDLLMTNDFNGGHIHVYKGPVWRKHITIRLRHTDFETYRSILASWHPLTDHILVGQTPALQVSSQVGCHQPTIINVFCGITGQRTCQLFTPQITDLPAHVTQMNSCGSMLACTIGSQLFVWNSQHTD